jgi:hypothetical protein
MKAAMNASFKRLRATLLTLVGCAALAFAPAA